MSTCRHRTSDAKKHHPHRPHRFRPTSDKFQLKHKPRHVKSPSHPRDNAIDISAEKPRAQSPSINVTVLHSLLCGYRRKIRAWIRKHSPYSKPPKPKSEANPAPPFRTWWAEPNIPNANIYPQPAPEPLFDPFSDDPPYLFLPQPYLSRSVARELMAFYGKDKFGLRRPWKLLSEEAREAQRAIIRDLGTDLEWAKKMHRCGKFGGHGVKSYGDKVIKEFEDRAQGGAGSGEVPWVDPNDYLSEDVGEGMGVDGSSAKSPDGGWGGSCYGEGENEEDEEDEEDGEDDESEEEQDPYWTIGESDLEEGELNDMVSVHNDDAEEAGCLSPDQDTRLFETK